MPNGVRNSIWAVFFLAGMAFMATLIFMIRPSLFSDAGVREKPGSSIVLSGSHEIPTTSNVSESEAEPQTVSSQKRAEAVASIPERKSQLVAVDQKSEPTADALPEAQPIAILPSEPQTSVPTASDRPVEMVHRIRAGRSVVGHVTLIGDLPAPKTLPVADGFCGPHSTATNFASRVFLRAADNSLADVVVFLRSHELQRRHWIAPPQQPVITQRGCQFEPYVTAIQIEQKIAFENLDPVLHNVHVRPNSSRNRELNVAQMPKGRPIIAEFKEPEAFIRVECNVHPYMVAYICVMDTPFFAVTKQDGRFHIPNLPPGEYVVTALHRRAGSITQKVKVTDEESPDINLTFHAPTELAQKND
jgi:hypothetical protein